MSPITTHVLDTMRGIPAAGVPLVLEKETEKDKFARLAQGVTDADGRVKGLLPDGAKIEPGKYRMTFDTAAYFRASSTKGFYPYVQIVFEVGDNPGHLHIPLLLSPYGYSTYRGS